jgi:hypothetical protein
MTGKAKSTTQRRRIGERAAAGVRRVAGGVAIGATVAAPALASGPQGAQVWLWWGQGAADMQPWTPEALIPAQSTEPPDDDTPSFSSPSPPSSPPQGDPDLGQPDNAANTDALVARIAAVNAVCDWLLQPYRLWCLANGYDLMAETLLPFGGYRDVRQVLKRTAGQLRAIAEANVDPEAEPVVLRRGDGSVTEVGRAPIRAVRRAAVASTNRQAAAVLDEAATVLLRSAENSTRRQVSYQRIAQAIDSSKVLLRST